MATPNSLAGVIKTQAALITSQASVIKDVVEENQNLKMKINQIQDGQSNNGNKLQISKPSSSPSSSRPGGHDLSAETANITTPKSKSPAESPSSATNIEKTSSTDEKQAQNSSDGPAQISIPQPSTDDPNERQKDFDTLNTLKKSLELMMQTVTSLQIKRDGDQETRSNDLTKERPLAAAKLSSGTVIAASFSPPSYALLSEGPQQATYPNRQAGTDGDHRSPSRITTHILLPGGGTIVRPGLLSRDEISKLRQKHQARRDEAVEKPGTGLVPSYDLVGEHPSRRREALQPISQEAREQEKACIIRHNTKTLAYVREHYAKRNNIIASPAQQRAKED